MPGSTTTSRRSVRSGRGARGAAAAAAATRSFDPDLIKATSRVASKPDLAAWCSARNLSPIGTKDDLKGRLREWLRSNPQDPHVAASDASVAAPPAIALNDMVTLADGSNGVVTGLVGDDYSISVPATGSVVTAERSDITVAAPAPAPAAVGRLVRVQ